MLQHYTQSNRPMYESSKNQPNKGVQVSDQQCMQLCPVGERILAGSQGSSSCKLTKLLAS
jgi:hypothetical protein